jgi:4a-hydroxytetrahydrobiopterin dehydratase
VSYRSVPSEEVAEKLREHPGWIVERDRLRRDYAFVDFKTALAFVNQVADVAERVNHHPNIRLHEWRFVELEVYTHAVGGLSDKDLELALAIDAAAAQEAGGTPQ